MKYTKLIITSALALIHSSFYAIEVQHLAEKTTLSSFQEDRQKNMVGKTITPDEFKILAIEKSPNLMPDPILNSKEKSALQKKINKITKRKSYKDIPFNELTVLIDCYLSLQNYDEALIVIKQAFNSTKDSAQRRTLKLQEADTLFKKMSYKNAIEVYEDFRTLYPGAHKEAEYALYKEIIAQYFLTPSSDRSQTKTIDTRNLTQLYQDKGNKTYLAQVIEIQQHCDRKLYEHELGIFEFYLKDKKYEAAQGRLATIKNTYVPRLPNLKPDALYLEYRLAYAQGLTKDASTVLAKMNRDFPSFMKTAKREEPHNDKKYVSRF